MTQLREASLVEANATVLPETGGSLRALAAKAFSEFFLGVAREVYPRYGFAMLNEAEYGTTIRLE